MPTTDRARVLAVKLLLRQTITSLQTDPFHLDCNGTILVDSLQHYAACVGLRAEDFMADTIRDCLVLRHRGKHLSYTIRIFCAAHASVGRSRMRSAISVAAIPATRPRRRMKQMPLPPSCWFPLLLPESCIGGDGSGIRPTSARCLGFPPKRPVIGFPSWRSTTPASWNCSCCKPISLSSRRSCTGQLSTCRAAVRCSVALC